jgi:hypothetical protein
MSDLLQTDYVPPKARFRRMVISSGFFLLGRGLQSATRFDKDLHKECADWPQGFRIAMQVLPNGPSLLMEKQGKRLKYKGLKTDPNADLLIEIKNTATAFRMIMAQIGAHHVYAEHKIGVVGNIADSMRFIRLVNKVEGYLFFGPLNKKILKKRPKNDRRQVLNSLHVYFLGIPFGI